MNEFARPNLAELDPTVARYVRGLGLDRIPTHTWTREAVDMKLVAEVAGELGGQGNRLRRPRFISLVAKLANVGIYLKFHTGKKNYGDFNVPLSEDDESPGMDSTVKIAFHPGGYNGEKSMAAPAAGYGSPSYPRTPQHISPSPLPPRPRPLSEPAPARGGYSSPVSESFQIPDLKPLSQLTTEADETQQAIEAALRSNPEGTAEEPTDINLRRLLHKLVRLQKLLRLIIPAVDVVIDSVEDVLNAPSCRPEEPSHVEFWPAESLIPEGFAGTMKVKTTTNPIHTQRPMGALSQIFDDEDNTNDQEETDQP